MPLSGADKRRVAAAATFRGFLKMGWRLGVIAAIALLAIPSGSTHHAAWNFDDSYKVPLLVEESRSIEFNATQIAGDGLDLGNWSILGGLSVTEIKGNRTFALLSMFFQVDFEVEASIELRNLTMRIVSTASDRHELAVVHLAKVSVPFSRWKTVVMPIEWDE